MKKATSKILSAKQKKELAALARLSDDKIDTVSIPEAGNWTDAKRGLFYRPVKEQLTLRLDADVLAWFREQAPKGYQTDINRALREHVELVTLRQRTHKGFSDVEAGKFRDSPASDIGRVVSKVGKRASKRAARKAG